MRLYPSSGRAAARPYLFPVSCFLSFYFPFYPIL